MKVFLTLLFFSLTFLHVRFFWGSDFPITHDGENHLYRIANYRIALREGQFPPRFAPNLLNGYGYPVFNYNYPLANILSVPFSVLKFHPEITLKILFTVFTFGGILGVFLLLRALRLTISSSVVGATVYGLSPYLLSTIIFRGNIGELMGISLLPWVCWALIQLKNNKHISLTALLIFTIFLLSHNLTVVFSLPFLLLFSVILFKREKQVWKHVFVHILISVMSVLWFWLPAIWEQKEVVVGSASLVSAFTDHLLSPTQLLTSPLEFGFSFPGFIDSLSFQLGFVQLFIIFLCGLYSIRSLKKKNKLLKNHQLFLFIFVLTGLSTVGTLEFTKPFWNIFSVFHILQFPWRLELFSTLYVAVLAGFIWYYLSSNQKRILLVLMFLQLFMMLRIHPIGYFHHDKSYYDFSGQSSSTQNENLPRTFNYINISEWSPHPEIIEGEGQFNVLKWTGSSHEYTVQASTPITIVEPTMHFLGWKTLMRSEGQEQIEVQHSFTSETQGRIAYQLKPGRYLINTTFTQQTPARVVGNSMFVLSLFTIIYLSFRRKIQW